MGSEWGAGAIGAAVAAVLGAVGILIRRWYLASGGYVTTTTAADIARSAEDRKARREDDAAERKQESAVLKEYKELARQQREDLAENRRQIHELRNEMQLRENRLQLEIFETRQQLAACLVECARCDERNAALEDALTAAGIPHRRHPADKSPDAAEDEK